MFLQPSDLSAFASIDEAKAETMIADAEALAMLAAPCLSDETFNDDGARVAAVRAILRGAIIRWIDAGSGAVTQQSAGPFSQSLDTRTERRGMFWPSEIAQLRDICSAFSNEGGDGAFMVDMTTRAPSGDLDPRPDLWFQWRYPAESDAAQTWAVGP